MFLRAAQKNDKVIMYAASVGRVIAVWVFWGDGGAWRNVAIYEGVCGVALGLGLCWEKFMGLRKEKERMA